MPLSEPSIFETIFQQSGAPTVILKAEAPDFPVVAQNDQYRFLANQEPRLSIGKRAFELFVANPQDEFSLHAYTVLVEAFQTCIDKKTTIKLPPIFQVNTPEGEVWLQTDVIPVFAAKGNVDFLICQTYDISKQIFLKDAALNSITREQNLTEDLAATNEELSASNEELTASVEELRQSQESLFESNRKLEHRVEERTKALTNSEARFRLMVDQSPVPMLVTMGKAMIFDIINQPMLNLIGKDASVIGMPWNEAMPELDGQDIVTTLLTTYDSGLSWEGSEVPIMINKNGAPMLGFYNITYRPLIENGQTIGMLQSAIDVTELVRARLASESMNDELAALNEELSASNEELAATNEEMTAANDALIEIQDQLTYESAERKAVYDHLKASEQNIRNMILQAPIGMCILEGNPLYVKEVNDAFLTIIGKTHEEIKTKPYWEILPEAAAFYKPITDRVIATGQTYHAREHEVMLIKYGKQETVFVDFVYEPMKDAEGKTFAIMFVVIDITEKVLSRKKIERAEESLRNAIDAAGLGTYSINATDRIFETSPRSKEFFGFAPEEDVPYEAALNQIHPDYRQKVAGLVEAAITKGERYDTEYPVIGYHDGKTRWVRGVGSMQHYDGKDFFTGVLNDITENKKDEIRKNDFIGMVSHELKTPLTSLNAYLQVLNLKASKSDDGFTVNALEQSVKQVKKMTAMINGFLNVTRLESGKIQIDKSHFDMADLVKESESETILMNDKHTFVFHPVEPTLVFADKDKIGQVINNLVSNAVKYSKTGSTIQVACITDGKHARFSVSDEGIGIEQQHLDLLFKRYYRVNNTSHISGFGIGLYLSAEIIEHHDGQIWAESEPGKGSTFYFTIPTL